MKILNVDFSENVEWSYETMLPTLQKANPNRTEKELKSLIKASKLVKYELQKPITKSTEGKKPSKSNDWDADNIQ